MIGQSDDELTIDTCIAEALNEPYAGWAGKLLSAFWSGTCCCECMPAMADNTVDGVRDMCASEESFNA